MAYVLRTLFKIIFVVVVVSILVACAYGQAIQPLALLVDNSFSNSAPAAKLATRSNLAALLGEAPSNAPFILVAFNRAPRLLFAGRISTKDCTAALAAADNAAIQGPTDLGKAMQFASNQSVLQGRSFDVAIISDFQLDAPATSPWSGRSLVSIMEQFHKSSVRRYLLIPVGAAADLQGIPAYGEILKQDPGRWLKGLLPPSAPPNVPVVKPFWRTQSVLLAAGIVLVLMPLGGISLNRYLNQRREERLLEQLRAEPLPNEDRVENQPETPIPVPTKPERRFRAVLLESGIESPIGANETLIGKNALSNVFLEDSFTTLALQTVGNGSSVVLSVRNEGERPIHLGSYRVQPNNSVRVPWGERIDCRISPDQTLRVLSFMATEVVNELS